MNTLPLTRSEFGAMLMQIMVDGLSNYRVRSQLPIGINPIVHILTKDQMVVDSVMEEDVSRAVFYVKVTL